MSTRRVYGLTKRRTECPHCGEEIVEEFTPEQARRMAEIFTRAADDLERAAALEDAYELPAHDPEQES